MREPARATERFLVTGALGCIGAWTVRALLDEGVSVVAFDKSEDVHRLRLLLEPDELAALTIVRGDITSLASIEAALDDHAITHVVHLAALQVPFCRADPPLGALVNVVGTVNVFEAVKRRREAIRGLVYTSSVGMFDAGDADPIDGHLHEDAIAHPNTHYGVYKLANEGTAHVYWLDDHVPSVGVRPMTVYGPGRDQGMTSGPTRAILAALVGRPFRIAFGGSTLFQFAPDAAAAIIAAARARPEGSPVFNLTGAAASIDEFVAAVADVIPGADRLITHEPTPLPFPDVIDADGLAAVADVPVTPLADGIRRTIELFQRRLAGSGLDPDEHGLEPVPVST
jgi:nucleoside-diphosphate-sugar epimerase